jgi:S1-C subfamily serine protease
MRDDASRFQISVPLQPGNSGGPSFEMHCNVVGVVVAVLRRAQVVNYAVKSSHLSRLCERVPGLRGIRAQKMGATPAFEDMTEGVIPGTVFIERYQ